MLLDEKFLKDVAALGVPVISDEIYHGLVYEGRAHSILEYTDQAFVLNGFSKRFAMTGLRLGYLIAPKSCMRSLQKLQQNLFICASSVAQQAGIAALRQAEPDVERMKLVYDERRRYMIARLREMGFEIKLKHSANTNQLTNLIFIASFAILYFSVLCKCLEPMAFVATSKRSPTLSRVFLMLSGTCANC